MNASYPIRLNRIREGLSIEPGIAMYNLFNFSNYDKQLSTLLNTNDVGPVNTAEGYVSGPDTYEVLNGGRSQRGSGTFDAGGPRTTEFQLKLNF
jgi:hypothetical protein